MTIGQLKEMIEELAEKYGEDENVVICDCGNSRYVYDITEYSRKGDVTAFWGSDYEAVCLFAGDQVGKFEHE